MPHPYPPQHIAQTKRHEGFHARVYPCPTGHPTIGYGTNLDAVHVPGITATSTINEEQAERLMIAEYVQLETQLLARAPWVRELDEVRYHTLLNMAYNMGVGGLLGFKRMLTALRAGQYAEASREMLDSLWARQVGDYAPDSAKGRENGRSGRAWELARQMRTGVWQDG